VHSLVNDEGSAVLACTVGLFLVHGSDFCRMHSVTPPVTCVCVYARGTHTQVSQMKLECFNHLSHGGYFVSISLCYYFWFLFTAS